MDFLTIIEWVVLVLVGLYGLGFLFTRDPDGGVQWMMHTQGWTLLVSAIAIGLAPISKFFVLLALPVSFYLPILLMKRRADAGIAHFRRIVEESKRTGVPIEDLLKDDLRRRGYEPDQE
ncbi:MAG: hypothetical protein IH851_07950 [Armatimonadetes bacterium]|nr:hypothetical protein [Armatimonadota bacterium]